MRLVITVAFAGCISGATAAAENRIASFCVAAVDTTSRVSAILED